MQNPSGVIQGDFFMGWGSWLIFIQMPDLYIIAGCNGAGKTTASYTVLPEMLHCKEFVNADNIALGLSPFNPEKVSIEAARIMLHRIDELMYQQESFAFETTLASRSYVSFIKKAKIAGYKVTMVYFWLNSVDTAKLRVLERVKNGGHDIPEETIIRRYKRGIVNLFSLYMPICNYWLLIDNSINELEMVVEGEFEKAIDIKNSDIWETIKKQHDAYKS